MFECTINVAMAEYTASLFVPSFMSAAVGQKVSGESFIDMDTITP